MHLKAFSFWDGRRPQTPSIFPQCLLVSTNVGSLDESPVVGACEVRQL